MNAPALIHAILALAATSGATTLSGQAECRARPGTPTLNHVVIAVHNLDTAATPFSRLGFTLKPGQLHPNNLLNRHIKFRDQTELELITLQGAPLDRMAREYADLISLGDGGAYVALQVFDMAAAELAAQRAGLEVRHSGSGPFQFLSFSPSSDAAGVFFVSPLMPPSDPDSIFVHRNGAVGLREAWLEAGPRLGPFLTELGATRCGTARLPDGREGQRWALGTGTLVLNPLRAKPAPPRVLGAVLAGPGAADTEVLQEFWIRFTP
jgi:glyoxalase-like protein